MSLASRSPFAVIEEEFHGFGRPPNAWKVPGAALSPDLPAGPLSPDELRQALLCRSTSYEVQDAAVGWLVHQAQVDGGRRIVVTVGMLLPGLRSRTACLVRWCPARAVEMQAEVVAAVVEAVLSLPPDRPRIAATLVWTGFRSGHRFATGHLTEANRHVSTECIGPVAPSGHPDLVLRRAVSEGVIDERDAAVIGDTRLGGVRLAGLALTWGEAYHVLAKRRRRAESRLVAWLGEQVA